MKTRALLFGAALSALVLAAPARATNGMRMIGFGPAQNSMGGVGVAATLDAGALASNPAGIVDLGRRVDVGGEFFKPSVKYTATGLDVGAPQNPFVLQGGSSLDSTRGGSPIPAIGTVYQLGNGLAAGVGVYGAAGMGVDYPVNLYGGPTLTSYLQGRLTPAVAYRVNDMLAVGATLNVMMAQMKFDVAAGAGQALHDTATSFGVGATFGVKFTPVKPLTLAAAYELKSQFQDFEFTVPSRPNPFAPPGSPLIPGGTDRLEFEQPQVVSFGAAVTPFEALLLAADVQWINWADTMGKGLPRYLSDPNATGALPFDMGWSNQWVFKVGAQLQATRSLAVRAGYNYGKMPLDPNRAFENLAFPAVAEHHLTAGLAWQATPAVAVQLAGMFVPASKIEGANASPPPPLGGTGQGITAYTTEMSQFSLSGGVSYRF